VHGYGLYGRVWRPTRQLFLSRSGEDLIGSLVRAVFDYGSTQYLPVGNVRFQRRDP
jgi:hypothetical protein